jgi:NADH-quinone oxidoreductase subunit M
MLFLIVGVLYERRHTREISEYGGISNVMPVYATISLIAFMSSLGLPLLNGFVGEFTILQGTFMESKAWAAWAVPGVVLGAAYLLWLYQRVYFGPVTNPKNEKLLDLSAREIAVFAPLVVLAFAIGIYPKPIFQILEQPVNNIVANARPGYPLKGAPATVEAQKTEPARPNQVLVAPAPSTREVVPHVRLPLANVGSDTKKPVAPVHTQLLKPAPAVVALAGK